MRRREWLVTAVSAVGAFGGCLGAPRGRGSGPESDGRIDRQAAAAVDLPVDRSELTRGAGEDAIPAITDPVFGRDWSGIELEVRNEVNDQYTTIRPRLRSDDSVIGVKRGGQARAYPLRLLNWHEVVNDRLDGPLLVTYCPLCKTGLVARRVIDGAPAIFGVSGLLWRSNLVLYDRPTRSLWSQLIGRAIRGPRTGHRLPQVPSTRTTLSAWRSAHPDTEVLLPPPMSETTAPVGVRNYTVNPYAAYEAIDRVGLGTNAFTDERLPPKTEVIGVTANGVAKAYSLPTVAKSGVVNDTVGTRPVVVTVGATGTTLAAYDRRVAGRVIRFSIGAGPDGLIWGGGSRWDVATGRAVDGPHAGRRLTPASDAGPMFWFSWLDLHPETAVYTG